MATTQHPLLSEAVELVELVAPAWQEISARIPVWHPRMEGEGGDAGGDGAAGDDGAGDGGDGDGSGAGDGGDPPEDWKAHSRKHERAAKKANAELGQTRQELDTLRARLAEIEGASGGGDEHALEQARREAADAVRAEVTAEFRDRIMRSEIRAEAAGKFANPALAVKLLDLDASDVFDADHEVDRETIAEVFALDASD